MNIMKGSIIVQTATNAHTLLGKSLYSLSW